MKDKWVNLAGVPDDHRFKSGDMFRRTNVGMNTPHPAEDYYQYMLLQWPEQEDEMLVVNITAHNIKAGYVPCAIRLRPETSDSVSVQEVCHVLGREHIYANMWNTR
jgi:hypothetical protein